MFKQTIYDSDPQSMNTDTNIYIWYPHQYFLQSYTIISYHLSDLSIKHTDLSSCTNPVVPSVNPRKFII